MSDIFREVEEDIQRERLLAFLRKYQYFLLGLALAIVLATAAYNYWRYCEDQAREAAASLYQNALKKADQGQEAAALQDLLRDAPDGYATLNRFVIAGLRAKSDAKAGAAAFEALAQDRALDPHLRETARLRAALAHLEAGEVEVAKSQLILLIAGPYRETAQLTLAALAINAQDWPGALRQLAPLQHSVTERQVADRLRNFVLSQMPEVAKP